MISAASALSDPAHGQHGAEGIRRSSILAERVAGFADPVRAIVRHFVLLRESEQGRKLFDGLRVLPAVEIGERCLISQRIRSSTPARAALPASLRPPSGALRCARPERAVPRRDAVAAPREECGRAGIRAMPSDRWVFPAAATCAGSPGGARAASAEARSPASASHEVPDRERHAPEQAGCFASAHLALECSVFRARLFLSASHTLYQSAGLYTAINQHPAGLFGRYSTPGVNSCISCKP